MREDLYLLGVAPNFLRKLTKNHVYSLQDLLSIPLSTLSQALRTSEESLVPLISKAKALLSTPLVPTSFRDERVPTGIRNVDVVLDGGVIPGGMYEIVGPPGVESTRLCLKIALSLVHTAQKRVLFCDSEGNFSLAMMNEFVKKREEVEELFAYLRVGTHSQLQQLLGEFERLGPLPFLVVMDGLPSLLRCPPFTDHSFDRTHKVMETAFALQELCNQHSCVLLVTNKFTSSGQDLTPLLGESWTQVLVARVFLEKTSEGGVIRAQKSIGWDVTSEVIEYSL